MKVMKLRIKEISNSKCSLRMDTSHFRVEKSWPSLSARGGVGRCAPTVGRFGLAVRARAQRGTGPVPGGVGAAGSAGWLQAASRSAGRGRRTLGVGCETQQYYVTVVGETPQLRHLSQDMRQLSLDMLAETSAKSPGGLA